MRIEPQYATRAPGLASSVPLKSFDGDNAIRLESKKDMKKPEAQQFAKAIDEDYRVHWYVVIFPSLSIANMSITTLLTQATSQPKRFLCGAWYFLLTVPPF